VAILVIFDLLVIAAVVIALCVTTGDDTTRHPHRNGPATTTSRPLR
jgi:hypothetical protein